MYRKINEQRALANLWIARGRCVSAFRAKPAHESHLRLVRGGATRRGSYIFARRIRGRAIYYTPRRFILLQVAKLPELHACYHHTNSRFSLLSSLKSLHKGGRSKWLAALPDCRFCDKRRRASLSPGRRPASVLACSAPPLLLSSRPRFSRCKRT